MADHAKISTLVFIQAGGRSSRMGTDKAWLEVAGQPMIEYALAAAAPIAASLSLVINAANPNVDRYQALANRWRARLLSDQHNYLGPLGGIHTALEHCQAGEAALILACDLPFITTEFLSLLCAVHQSGNPQSITVPLDQNERLQPLAAIYDSSCLSVVAAQLAAQRLKVDLLFDLVPTRRIAFSAFAHLPGAQQFFLNLNSPEDHRNAQPLIVKPPHCGVK